MATRYSANRSKALASPAQLVEQGDMGKIKVMYDSFTTVVGQVLAISDIVEFMEIPAGARIVNFKAVWEDIGATGAGSFGFASDDDALSPIQTLSTAGQYLADSAIATNVGLFAAPLAAATKLQLKITTATDGVAATSIKVLVEYAFI